MNRIAVGADNDALLNAEIVFAVVAPANLGDVNDDGEINLGDVQLLFMYTRSKAELTDTGLVASDVNLDGEINLGDVQLLFMHTRGKAELG